MGEVIWAIGIMCTTYTVMYVPLGNMLSISGTEVKSCMGRSYFIDTMIFGGIKGESQDFGASTRRRTKRLVHWQSISWNNETSLLTKSEFIHDYNHGSPLMYSLSWSTFLIQSLIIHNCISCMSMISCKDRRNTWVPLECLDMSQP